MSERYSYLFHLSSGLYYIDCPVIIEAGALLKDNKMDRIIVQLKMRNLSNNIIVAAKVSINAFEPNGQEVEGVSSFPFLDIRIKKGEEFGSRIPIVLPNNLSRKFLPCITEIVFDDGTTWSNKPTKWSNIPSKKELSAILTDNEWIYQYSLEIGDNCRFIPETNDVFFFCTCGAINLASEKNCYNCKREYSELVEALNIDNLKCKSDERILFERKKAQEESKAKAEAEAALIEKEKLIQQEREAKAKRIKKVSGITVAAVTSSVAVILMIVNVIIPLSKRNNPNNSSDIVNKSNITTTSVATTTTKKSEVTSKTTTSLTNSAITNEDTPETSKVSTSNVTYNLDNQRSITISGSGDMDDYDYSINTNPYSDNFTIINACISEGVTSIGDCAFYLYYGLKNISIPNSITRIGKSAFAACTSLTEITIPDSVSSIGEAAFACCYNLKSITIPYGITSITDALFLECSSLNSFIIPDSVNSIGRDAFSGCTSLDSITIPNSVTYIGVFAFAGCTSLENITIPNSVTYIEGNAFAGCTSLENITIPNSVTYIRGGAFAGCSSLKSITIPDSVAEIGECALGYSDDYLQSTPQKYANFTIKGKAGSAAEQYAKDNEFNFVAI